MPVETAAKVEALRHDFKSGAAVADLLGVSRSRVTRWLQGSGIDPVNAERVDLLELVWANLLRLYEPEAAREWLLGVNPQLAQGLNGGFKGLFEAGKVGLLPGIDYANPDLSHFHSRHFWETGLITPDQATGWLGRWLDRAGTPDNPLQGVSMDYSLSPVLRSGGAPVAAVRLAVTGFEGRLLHASHVQVRRSAEEHRVHQGTR